MKKPLWIILCFIVTLLSLAAKPERATAGPRITPFTFKTLDNEIIHVDSLTQKGPVIITFWAMWCKPCKEEMNALAEACADPPFDATSIISVNIDTPRSLTRVKSYVSAHDIPFPCCTDPGREILRIFNTANIPFLAVLNKNREVVIKHSGYVPGDVDNLARKIEDLLKRERE